MNIAQSTVCDFSGKTLTFREMQLSNLFVSSLFDLLYNLRPLARADIHFERLEKSTDRGKISKNLTVNAVYTTGKNVHIYMGTLSKRDKYRKC